ncbi:sel1 repeat family protein [Phyllobacterium sp. YR531]|uniref:sel1 repeat family protein n=1 Tax=Phyllobacterium sp. YR531 TaxID=1144343 RepID=UPI00026F63DF|nr:sel1 repeat family protein [Phyllobacterium sp. YR531]EJN03883.1 hypothetical protein PMI41_01518 [Phyllobacterium sp. YR531]
MKAISFFRSLVFLAITVTTPALSLENSVQRDEFLQLQEGLRESSNKYELQTLYGACPADIWKTKMSFWKPFTTRFGMNLNACRNDPKMCLRNCLGEQDSVACFSLAVVWEMNGESKDYPNWQRLFALSCALGHPGGCTNRAASILSDTHESDPFPDPNEPETARCLFRSFQETCAARDAWGCAMHGASYQFGNGVQKNNALARRYYEQSCEIDRDFAACYMGRDFMKKMDE